MNPTIRPPDDPSWGLHQLKRRNRCGTAGDQDGPTSPSWGRSSRWPPGRPRFPSAGTGKTPTVWPWVWQGREGDAAGRIRRVDSPTGRRRQGRRRLRLRPARGAGLAGRRDRMGPRCSARHSRTRGSDDRRSGSGPTRVLGRFRFSRNRGVNPRVTLYAGPMSLADWPSRIDVRAGVAGRPMFAGGGDLVAGERDGSVGHATIHSSPGSAPTGAGRTTRPGS